MNESSQLLFYKLKQEAQQQETRMSKASSSDRIFFDEEEKLEQPSRNVNNLSRNIEDKMNQQMKSSKTSLGEGRIPSICSQTSKKMNDSTSTNQPVVSGMIQNQLTFKNRECFSNIGHLEDQQVLKRGRCEEFGLYEKSGMKRAPALGYESEEDGSEVQFQQVSHSEYNDISYQNQLEQIRESLQEKESVIISDSLQSFAKHEAAVISEEAKKEVMLDSSPQMKTKTSNKMILQDIINSQNSGLPFAEEYNAQEDREEGNQKPDKVLNSSHSLYSDDKKPSVFLYSETNDEIVQSQLSQRLSQVKSINGDNPGLLLKTSSKQSFKMPSLQSSQFQSQIGENNFAFKTNSSNFQLSDITMSIGKDNFKTMNEKMFFDGDPFEIKEEVDAENCHTPMNQIQDGFKSKDSLLSKQAELFQNQDLKRQMEKEFQQFDKLGEVEESFQDCDYEDYMEEKVELSDQPLSYRTDTVQIQKSLNNHSYYERPLSHATIKSEADANFGNIITQNRGFQNTVLYSQMDTYDKPEEQSKQETKEVDQGIMYLQKQQQQYLQELYLNSESLTGQSNNQEKFEEHEEGKAELIEFLTGNEEEKEESYQQQFNQISSDHEPLIEDMNSNIGVVNRLYMYEKQKQLKLEAMRREKQIQELKNCLPKPNVSQVSKKLKSKVNPQYMQIINQKEKTRLEDLRLQKELEEKKELTGRPQISHHAKSLHRNLDDLYNWQKQNQEKKEKLQKERDEQKEKEISEHLNQAQKFMSKESKKYINNKENLYQSRKIEDRLLMYGQQQNHKKELALQEKKKHDKDLTQMACLITKEQNKKLVKTLKNCSKNESSKEENFLSEQDLSKIQSCQERQNLYKLYYQEKKKKGFMQNSIDSSGCGQLGLQNQTYSHIQNQLMNTQQFGINQRNNYSEINLCSPMQQNWTFSEGLPFTPISNQQSIQVQNNNNLYCDMINSARTHHNYTSLDSKGEQLQVKAGNPVYEYYPNYCSFGSMPSTPFALVRPSQSSENQNSQDIYTLLRKANSSSQSSQVSSSISTSRFNKPNESQKQDLNAKKKPQNQPSQGQFKKGKKCDIIKQEEARRSRSRDKKISQQDSNDFFKRNQKWSKERKQKIEEEQKKKSLIESMKCTFQPRVSENSNKLMSPSQSPLRKRGNEQSQFGMTSHVQNALQSRGQSQNQQRRNWQQSTFDNVMNLETVQSQSSIPSSHPDTSMKMINIQTVGPTQMLPTSSSMDQSSLRTNSCGVDPYMLNHSQLLQRNSEQYNYALALYQQLKN